MINKVLKLLVCCILFQMLVFTVFSQTNVSIKDSLQSTNNIISENNKAKISTTNTLLIVDPQIGKLPLKKSQLPELFLVIFLLSIVAVLRYFYPRYLPELFQHFYSLSFDARILKNDRIADLFPSLFYDILFIILSTAFILFFGKIQYHKLAFINWKNASLISIVFIVLILLKHYFLKLLCWVFKFNAVGNVIIAYGIVSRHIITIILIPIISFLLLINPPEISKIALVFGIIFILLIYVFHLLKMVVFVKKTSSISFLDIFTYLCSVEILPLCLLIVLFYRQFITKT